MKEIIKKLVDVKHNLASLEEKMAIDEVCSTVLDDMQEAIKQLQETQNILIDIYEHEQSK